ncbi:MAG: glutamine--fructose-6-phosphate transaminase (isomerizing), partial [Maricaulis sp.]|nr:glutamine--fructose-6-phosphate transaminase (isomerizing) [Maricaulis sp.]
MCGIVGVAGDVDARRILLAGLMRLEYRGYDSAGIAIQGPDGDLQRVRAAGKVSALAKKLPDEIKGSTGIAHTRWATHGAPTETNAHPHKAGRIQLIHNGIIENFGDLRKELKSKGCVFTSETDSEVVAHLLDRSLELTSDPRQALIRTLKKLEGAFALAAIIERMPGLVLGARRGAPLIAAFNDTVGFLASDIMAITGEAHSMVYLEEGDAVLVRPGRLELFDVDGQNIERSVVPAVESALVAEKGNHRHFMQKEIYEQPEVVGRTLSAYIDAASGTFKQDFPIDFAAMSRLLIIGCGTASYAAQVAEYWIEDLAGLPVEIDLASEFRYRNPAFMKDDAALFISQSGETADTLEAMRMCKAAGLKTIVLVNSPHSSMAREADVVVPTLAGPEIGVASTKAFT